MKGQYLAVESVAAFGMGLLVALGSVTVFAGYKSDIMNSVENLQADTVSSKVVDAVYSLKGVDSGSIRVDLPETLAGSGYTVAFTDGVTVSTPGEQYSEKTGLEHSYDFSGTVDGGTVKVYKNGDQFSLRPE